MEAYDLIVVGGGAAGFFGAITTAEFLKELGIHSYRVLILEKGGNFLSKVRISGGGRCNVTNACYEPAELVKNYPRGGKELLGAFFRFQPLDMIQWLEKNGVRLKTETDGRVFPISDQSRSVIDCLLSRVRVLHIEMRVQHPVQRIEFIEEKRVFLIELTDSQRLETRNVLLATGGGSASAYTMARLLGHTIVPPIPSLFALNISDPQLHALSGLSMPDCYLSLPDIDRRSAAQGVNFAQGPVLITHQGLSGPTVLRLSAWSARALALCNYQTTLHVNWLAGFTQETFLEYLKAYRDRITPLLPLESVPYTAIPKRLWQYLLGKVRSRLPRGTTPAETIKWSQASNQMLRAISDQVVNDRYTIVGRSANKAEFVTAGGVSLQEVDFRTMQSRLLPGLFFAGEYLDIDGITGGFNFQAAWTTSWIAGKSIAQKLSSDL